MASEVAGSGVHIDFFADWAARAREELTAVGCSRALTESELTIAWFNRARRAVAVRRRRTAVAREFHCPPTRAQALAKLVHESENGLLLNRYLSRKLKDPEYDDALLNDWKIHHFHLEETLGPDGFAKRTPELLFALVSTDVLYLLDVGDHQHFSLSELFARIVRNWPELVEHLRLDDEGDALASISDADRAKFRRAASFPPTVVDGVAFAPLGGGAVMSGTSLQAIQDTQQLYYLLHSLEGYTRAEASRFKREIRAAGHEVGADFTVRLEFGDGSVHARHVESGTSFDITAAITPNAP